jgi:hypothetical protein
MEILFGKTSSPASTTMNETLTKLLTVDTFNLAYELMKALKHLDIVRSVRDIL